MTYPYPALLPLLTHSLDVPTYLALTRPLMRRHDSYSLDTRRALGSPYWTQLPVGRYTVCPLCMGTYTAAFDTCTFWGWAESNDLRRKIPYGPLDAPSTGCPHFMGLHVFLSLHQHIPEGTYYSTGNGEVPFISPALMRDDIPSYAVLAAVPICRIQQDTFVPTYTAWWIAYFTQNPPQVQRAYLIQEHARYGHDREFFPHLLSPSPVTYPGYDTAIDAYDLTGWCHAGRLGYLDYTQPDLPLRIGAGMTLPRIYTQIQGDRHAFTYRHGIKGTS